jgi:hypothetical protein
MTLPDTCPGCKVSAGTLSLVRADVKGLAWVFCDHCHIMILVNAEGVVLHVGTPQ